MTSTDAADSFAPPSSEQTGSAWSQSLASGAPGIVLLLAEYARTGRGTHEPVHAWVRAMTRHPVTARPDACGLYRGAPAVAFALHAADHPAYRTTLHTLDQHITTLVEHRLTAAHQRIDRRHRPALREFDLIRGLTGLGAYLLHRNGYRGLLREVLAYLVRLTEPLTADGATLPGWWTGNGSRDRPSPDWPGGHGNLGMAHGITGPLALMAAGMLRGVTVTGQADAMGRILDGLDRWCQGAGRRAWWPETISHAEWQAAAVRHNGPGRPSWCYGTPGVARAQQVAALALGDRHRQRDAEAALAAGATDSRQLARLGDASLCHGWAGLVHTVRRAAADAGSGSELAAVLPGLHLRLEEYLRRHGLPSHDGLLEGATGVRLARHAAVNMPPATRWDACLLLDGGESPPPHPTKIT